MHKNQQIKLYQFVFSCGNMHTYIKNWMLSKKNHFCVCVFEKKGLCKNGRRRKEESGRTRTKKKKSRRLTSFLLQKNQKNKKGINKNKNKM